MQKKYTWNIRKPLRLGSCKWILQMIKINDYLVHFPVPDGMTTTRVSCEEFIDILENGIPYQWKLEFKKEGPRRSRVAKTTWEKDSSCKKEHNDNRKGKQQDKSKLHHERHHSLGKCHAGKHKNFCVAIM
eukprot:6099330-Ditylum_brightwellii.AAC.1